MIADKSIISAEAPAPGIPIKKSTLLGILAVLLGGIFVTSMWMQGGVTPAKVEPTAEKPQGQVRESGQPAAIDEEQKAAERAKALRDANGGVTASAPKDCVKERDGNSPVPPCLQRERQEGAIGERGVAIAKNAVSPAGYTTAPGTTGTGAAAPRGDTVGAEQEAQARRSNSMAYDAGDSSSGGNAAGKLDVNSVATALGYSPAGSAAPSAALQPAIDAALNAAKAANKTGGSGSSQRAWLNDYAAETGSAKRNAVLNSYATVSPYTLHQGKVIPAVLGKKINSDLPGSITAYTTVDVYDSLGHGHLLLPKGSVLVGRYDSDVKVGQERVLFAFQRVILPSGQAFDLPSASGSDLAGAAGVEGDVNNHFFKMFASSFMVAWIADRVQQPTAVSNTGTTTSPAGQVLVDVSRTILDRNKQIAPTITLDQGTRINVEVVKDMEFNGPYSRSNK